VILVDSVLNIFINKIIRKKESFFSYDTGRDGNGGGILLPICPLDTDLLISGTFYWQGKK